MYEAKILADSVSPDGVRLTSFEVEYPHAIHKDIMTHRMFSRNFQSFRAFPPEKVIEKIEADPFIPDAFRKREKGMGEGDVHSMFDQLRVVSAWNSHIEHSIEVARKMIALDLAKAQVNFVLQDLTSIRGIITATEWDNFWDLRLATDSKTDKPLARPEVYKIASMMKQAYDESTPKLVRYDEWHTPLVDDIEISEPSWQDLKAVSTGRCARVSYLTHDGERDPDKDIELHYRLKGDKHMSPFEHVARPIEITGKKWVSEVDATSRKATGLMLPGPDWRANFYGWHSYRLDVENRDSDA